MTTYLLFICAGTVLCAAGFFGWVLELLLRVVCPAKNYYLETSSLNNGDVMKIFIHSTYLVCIVLLTGCASSTPDLQLAQGIRQGMTPDQVVQSMGGKEIVAREFAKNYEEWHYCDNKPWGGDQKFVAVYFIEGEVASMKYYSAFHGSGDCQAVVKRGNYREPDNIREYRIKVGRY